MRAASPKVRSSFLMKTTAAVFLFDSLHGGWCGCGWVGGWCGWGWVGGVDVVGWVGGVDGVGWVVWIEWGWMGSVDSGV